MMMFCNLTILLLEWPKLYGVLAILSAIGLMSFSTIFQSYQDARKVIMKGYVYNAWNPITGEKISTSSRSQL